MGLRAYRAWIHILLLTLRNSKTLGKSTTIREPQFPSKMGTMAAVSSSCRKEGMGWCGRVSVSRVSCHTVWRKVPEVSLGLVVRVTVAHDLCPGEGEQRPWKSGPSVNGF